MAVWRPVAANDQVRAMIDASETASSAAASMRNIVRAGRPRWMRAMSIAHSGSAT